MRAAGWAAFTRSTIAVRPFVRSQPMGTNPRETRNWRFMTPPVSLGATHRHSDPLNPAAVGHLGGLNFGYYFDVSGAYAYVADFMVGLHVVDISDPANPQIVTTLTGIPRPWKSTFPRDLLE